MAELAVLEQKYFYNVKKQLQEKFLYYYCYILYYWQNKHHYFNNFTLLEMDCNTKLHNDNT